VPFVVVDNPPYDGVQLMVNLTKAIRAKVNPGFLISHAPQTPYLTMDRKGNTEESRQYFGSYLAIIAQLGGLGPTTIDFLNIQAYNNEGYQGCPDGSKIVNRMTESYQLPEQWNNLVVPACKANNLLYGQLLNDLMTPWCKGSLAPLNPGCGAMFWLQRGQADVSAADAAVDALFPVVAGRLSPPEKVVYYLNGAIDPPTSGYSRCNVIIIGFAYAALNSGNNYAGRGPFPPPPNSKVEPWASFGMFYSMAYNGMPYSLAPASFGPALKAWKSVEPNRRKIMIGIGGADSAPLYGKWAQGRNVDIVAQGLKEFLDAFEIPFDGVDIDYEDSANLRPNPRLSSVAALTVVSPPARAVVKSTAPGPALAIAAIVVCALAVLAVIVLMVYASKREVKA
jgi:hypothetical protein